MRQDLSTTEVVEPQDGLAVLERKATRRQRNIAHFSERCAWRLFWLAAGPRLWAAQGKRTGGRAGEGVWPPGSEQQDEKAARWAPAAGQSSWEGGENLQLLTAPLAAQTAAMCRTPSRPRPPVTASLDRTQRVVELVNGAVLTSLALCARSPVSLQEEALLTLAPEAPHRVDTDLGAGAGVPLGALVHVCAWRGDDRWATPTATATTATGQCRMAALLPRQYGFSRLRWRSRL